MKRRPQRLLMSLTSTGSNPLILSLSKQDWDWPQPSLCSLKKGHLIMVSLSVALVTILQYLTIYAAFDDSFDTSFACFVWLNGLLYLVNTTIIIYSSSISDWEQHCLHWHQKQQTFKPWCLTASVMFWCRSQGQWQTLCPVIHDLVHSQNYLSLHLFFTSLSCHLHEDKCL